MSTRSDNLPPKLPKSMFDARCKSCWMVFGLVVLIALSFWSLDLQWARFASVEAMARMGKFIGELLRPNFESAFLAKVAWATIETLAMSALGTLLAAVFGLLWALPASKTYADDPARWRTFSRGVLNVLRSIPELVWAALLLIAVGLGPFAGTFALALHTTGVLGRLFAESIENSTDEPAFALRTRGVGSVAVFWYATFPQVLPQLISYTLYRWENNIRAAAVLGVVGAGGLGQMLSYHMGLFQMSETSTVLLAMIILVALVDVLSYISRTRLMN
ncbi:MAG: phosphonate ABC transporter, permease protein PhnE [Limnobacter sp.]|jgi:phosphonate transport system permease protein|uniref:phosphonate ABC transporter, permease protein PhnE n=1 Tax=unclassified Limnobacter TaxID=2630203 RepID=UPI000CF37A8A|nr:phosphonate ABC transporter, permease protein PhnE [Limnobacter sp. SAORIC-690]MBU0542064.1 phosphonate ABC transporter, permease protein PhnE [Gammaproteobacteria bacterium]PQJ24888.1 phosphonate ABC transporter, permease protein PhnE [Limnobacter sp. SAORIC-690]